MRPRRVVAAALAAAVEIAVVTSVARAQVTDGAGRAATPANAVPPPATPDAVDVRGPRDVREAEAHFRRGVALYKDEDLGGALVEFKRAYELAPNYHVLYDLGQTYFQLQRYAEALDTFRRFLTLGAAQIPADKRAAVERDVQALEERVGLVDVTVNPEGALVTIDDEPVGTSPLAKPVTVSVGHRKITVSRPGFPSQERFVDVAAGDRTSVAFELTAPSSSPTPSPTFEPSGAAPVASADAASASPRVVVMSSPPASEPNRAGQWIAWGITSALGASAAVTGVLALAAKGDLSAELDTFPGNPDAIDEARSRTKAFGIATDALLGATVIAGGVALVMTVRHRSSPPPSSTNVGIGPRGLELGGRF
jgi:hypothetical protein